MTARLAFAVFALAAATPAAAQRARPAAPVQAPRSAPVTNVRYTLTFDSTTAAARTVKVGVAFDVAGPGPVLLSLPTWTPGAYEVSNFARHVSSFAPAAAGRALRWDKTDYDTWRIEPAGAKTIEVTFDVLADTLDNAMAWARADFLLVNGTNVFPYFEGRSLDFPATVTVRTESAWHVATGMRPGGARGTYGEATYHDLVDMPFFIGRVDYDSTQVAGKWSRLATYPAGAFAGAARQTLTQQIAGIIPVQSAVFGETPWDSYTTLIIFDSAFGGGSALEHQNSHVGIYNPQFQGTPVLASITGHEIFHAWNVKRLRPADLVPYAYSHPQPTVWLWVSEGITDYYADLSLVRAGIIDSTQFLGETTGKIETVAGTPPVALEDASLSTWIHPTDGTGYIYYPKGSLAGFLLDIMIRDASDNRQSLDQVMREVYRATFKAGRGFTAADWWNTVTRAAGGKSFTDFAAKYIDGREPFPWTTVLPLAGLRLVADTVHDPRVGLSTAPPDSAGVTVLQVMPGGAAAQAGVRPGDRLVSVGDVKVGGNDWGSEFRSRYASRDGQPLPIVVRRGAETLTLQGKVVLVQRVETRMEFDANASEKAVRIRRGIMTGQ